MKSFKEAWALTHQLEKGYSNNPSDSGGETNHGITIAVARKNGYTESMKDLPLDVAESIAKKEYWDVLRLDDIAVLSERVALELFDTGFNCGPLAAAMFLQRGLNCFNRSNRIPADYPEVTEDGKLGPLCVISLAAYFQKRGKDGELVMLRYLNAAQGMYYDTLRKARIKDEEFTFGWFLNRVTI